MEIWAVHRSDPLLGYGALWSAAEPPPSVLSACDDFKLASA